MQAVSESGHCCSTERIDAKFIEGPNGPLFCLFACSESAGSYGKLSKSNGKLLRNDQSGELGHRHIVLFVPPLGEEVNLCRRFFSLLRTRLTTEGLHSVQPDLYGTGDSTGKFEEATCKMWKRDLEYVIDQFCLKKEGVDISNKLSIIAVRAGCLFAQQLMTSPLFFNCNVDLKNIVYIQPELNGLEIVNRLFRARITAQRFSGNKKQTSADLWACIENGETVHAGGHALSSELCKALQYTSLELGTPARFGHQVLFRLEAGDGNHESVGWENINMVVKPFWQSYDTEPEAALINEIAEKILR